MDRATPRRSAASDTVNGPSTCMIVASCRAWSTLAMAYAGRFFIVELYVLLDARLSRFQYETAESHGELDDDRDHTNTPEQEARRRTTVVWVVALAFVGLLFDGYDLVVYGTVLSTFLRDSSQIGMASPAVGGALGSYALVGVLVGALLAGTMSDVLGRRKLMLLSYTCFSVGMAVTAPSSCSVTWGGAGCS